MKLWLAFALLSVCTWAADEAQQMRTVLPNSQSTGNKLSMDTRSRSSEAGGCAALAVGTSVFNREFEPSGSRVTSIDTPQLALSYSASATTVKPGGLITLILAFEPKPRMHIYASGAEPFTPIDWQLFESKAWSTNPVRFPPAHMVSLPAVNETVPVFDSRVRLERDVRIKPASEIGSVLNADPCLVIEGSFRYQACDDKECYFPKVLPLRWTFRKE